MEAFAPTFSAESRPSEQAGAPRRDSDAKDPLDSHSAGPVDGSSGRTPGSSEFFARTAEIVESGAPATQDRQTIVLREVHEWVASSPGTTSAERDESAAGSEFVQPKPRPLAVSREYVEEDSPGQPRPVEQSFELSIGTISVIVEKPEKPLLPDPPVPKPANAAREPEPRFSRLGRSYL
jgi:hypothetical protein